MRQSIKKYDVSTDEACKSMCLKQGRVRFTGSSGNLDEYFKRRVELLCFQTVFLLIFFIIYHPYLYIYMQNKSQSLTIILVSPSV